MCSESVFHRWETVKLKAAPPCLVLILGTLSQPVPDDFRSLDPCDIQVNQICRCSPRPFSVL